MKYIRTEDENGKNEIFVFPDSVDHDCMAEALSGIKNETTGNWHRVRRYSVSAGFVNAKLECYGESLTLGLASVSSDTDILRRQMK